MENERGDPCLVEDLGWHDASATRHAPTEFRLRLPGESSDPADDRRGIAILGPDLASLELEGDAIHGVAGSGKHTQAVFLTEVEQLVVLGSPTLPGDLVQACLKHEVTVFLVDASGRHTGCLETLPEGADAAAATAQFRAFGDTSRRLRIARRLIAAKIRNYACLVRALDPEPTGSEDLSAWLTAKARETEQVTDLDRLLGIEGAAAGAWFRRLARAVGPGFRFQRRVAPNAEDPVNVLLNIAQTALYRHMILAGRSAGLLVAQGILHTPRSGHAALASDLQEPFRHVADRVVLEAVRHLHRRDFRRTPDGPFALRILPRAARTFALLIHTAFARAVRGRLQAEPVSYRMQFLRQARSLRRHLLDPEHPFHPFEHP
jgi:CRISPR-associated endonuclease Cas1